MLVAEVAGTTLDVKVAALTEAMAEAEAATRRIVAVRALGEIARR